MNIYQILEERALDYSKRTGIKDYCLVHDWLTDSLFEDWEKYYGKKASSPLELSNVLDWQQFREKVAKLEIEEA